MLLSRRQARRMAESDRSLGPFPRTVPSDRSLGPFPRTVPSDRSLGPFPLNRGRDLTAGREVSGPSDLGGSAPPPKVIARAEGPKQSPLKAGTASPLPSEAVSQGLRPRACARTREHPQRIPFAATRGFGGLSPKEKEFLPPPRGGGRGVWEPNPRNPNSGTNFRQRC
jgi:hypothetical protein